MDHSGIEKLIKTIGINYPQSRKYFESSGGGISESVINEWYRQIGYLSYEDAVARLDAWMESEDHKRAPMAVDFKLVKPRKKDDIFHAPISHIWKIIRGRLYDEEDREYVIDPTCELPFYWNEQYIACQGKKQYPHIRRGTSDDYKRWADELCKSNREKSPCSECEAKKLIETHAQWLVSYLGCKEKLEEENEKSNSDTGRSPGDHNTETEIEPEGSSVPLHV